MRVFLAAEDQKCIWFLVSARVASIRSGSNNRVYMYQVFHWLAKNRYIIQKKNLKYQKPHHTF